MVLSIIVPVYNGAGFIKKNIENLMSIPMRDTEIIYIDDGSTDDTSAIIKTYSEKDDRILLIQKENGGPGQARNVGLEKATGKYVVFVDSDDYIDVAEFQRLVSFADENDVDLLQYEYRLVDAYGKLLEEHHGNRKIHEQFLSGPEYLRTEGIGESLHISYIYRREMLIGNNIRMAEGVIHEDVEYAATVLWYAKNIYVSDACIYNYVMRAGSIMHTKGKIHKIDFGSSVERLKIFAQNEVDQETYKAFFEPFIVKNYYNIAHVALQNGMSIRRVFREEPGLRKDILEWLPHVNNRKYRLQYFCFRYGLYELYSIMYRIYNSIRVSHIQ